MKKFLVIAPHHDDEVLGCGGKIIKLIDEGYIGTVIYITSGWSGIPRINSKKQAIVKRETEANNACKILGIKKTFFLRQEDRDWVVNGKLVQSLIKIIRKIQPDMVFAPHNEESDSEHKKTYELTKEALWLAKSLYLPKLGKSAKNIDMLYLYEVWTPMEKIFIKEDITDVLSRKQLAMDAYKSQSKGLSFAVEGLNLYRGSMTSNQKKYVEVFQAERP